MKCKTDDCNNERALMQAPYEMFCGEIPFIKIEIRLWNWRKKRYEEYCDECLLELQSIDQNKIYDSIAEGAYNQGYSDACKSIY